MKIKAAVTFEQGADFKMEDVELKELAEDECLVKIVASGVCHTDITAKNNGLVSYPSILGHEGSGIVEKVGKQVTEFEEGDHVVMSFSFCGHCDACISGRPASCEKMFELQFGGKDQHGCVHHQLNDENIGLFFGQSSFATYSVVNQQNMIKVDKDVDISILGPLGCGFITGLGTVTETMDPEFGANIAVFGVGSVGLAGVMAANLRGCGQIIAVDLNDDRLELADEVGATHTLNSSNLENFSEQLIEMTDGRGLDYILDTTGVIPLIKEGINSLREEGELCEVGIGGELDLNLFDGFMTGNKRLTSMQMGGAIPKIIIPKMIEQFKKGHFPFDKLIKKYSFKDIEKAFEDMEQGKVLKPVLVMDDKYL